MSVFSPSIYTVLLLAFLLLMMVLCVRTGKLTVPAACGAALIGALVFFGAGISGMAMLLVFFICSVVATGYRKDLKPGTGNEEKNGRNIRQVFANGGVAGIMGALMLIDPLYARFYGLMMAAALASALADTLSSELGMVYGRRFYHVLTFRTEFKGLDGVVSLEGTLIGAGGAGLIGLIYGGFSRTAICVLAAGVLGNLIDSVLGAVLERKGYIGNNMVNFLNTLFAALAGLLFCMAVKII